MGIFTAALGITTTAVAISRIASTGDGQAVSVTPLDGTVYVGGADVTAASGTPATPSMPVALTLPKGETLYAIAAAGTVNVRIMRVGADS